MMTDFAAGHGSQHPCLQESLTDARRCLTISSRGSSPRGFPRATKRCDGSVLLLLLLEGCRDFLILGTDGICEALPEQPIHELHPLEHVLVLPEEESVSASGFGIDDPIHDEIQEAEGLLIPTDTETECPLQLRLQLTHRHRMRCAKKKGDGDGNEVK